MPTETTYEDADGRIDVAAFKRDLDAANVSHTDLAIEVYRPDPPTPGRYEHVRRVINSVAASDGTAHRCVQAFHRLQARRAEVSA